MKRSLPTLLSVLALLLLAACGPEGGRSSLDPRTDFAETIQGLYITVFVWSVMILLVVWGVLGYVLFKFRERPGTTHPKQTHGHLGVEIAWTIGPAMIVVAILVPTIGALFETQSGDPESAYVIDVIGHQFWWEFRYPEGPVTANELHLPVDRPVSLRLQSADVIHSFWVPQLGGKRDVNPPVTRPEGGSPRYNWLHFTVGEPGVFGGQCAEFCGMSHALMGTRAIAESEQDFQAWLAAWTAGAALPVDIGGGPAGTPPDSAAAPADPAPPMDSPAATAAQLGTPTGADDPVARGRTTFMSSLCIACHAIQGTTAMGVAGPNLTLFGRRSTLGAGWLENTAENLERWITDPGSVKPGVLMPGVAGSAGGMPGTNLSPEQVRDVAAFLLSLR
jgi:cytochrome c oxidase subunit 2